MEMKQLSQWKSYFRKNAKNTLALEAALPLPKEQIRRVSRSIQNFHIGEASEGMHLRNLAAKHERSSGAAGYLECIEHLIREENRHSAYLGSFMRAQNIPSIRSSWTDAIFRFVRHALGLELSIRTLVTAELVALTYYDCLGAATDSRELSTICARMLDEEKKHVQFQMHSIHAINIKKLPPIAALADIGHALLLAGTLVAVWAQHRPVLSVKYGFRSFFAKVWGDYAEYMNEGMLAAGYVPEVDCA